MQQFSKIDHKKESTQHSPYDIIDCNEHTPILDFPRGEFICMKCGLVLSERLKVHSYNAYENRPILDYASNTYFKSNQTKYRILLKIQNKYSNKRLRKRDYRIISQLPIILSQIIPINQNFAYFRKRIIQIYLKKYQEVHSFYYHNPYAPAVILFWAILTIMRQYKMIITFQKLFHIFQEFGLEFPHRQYNKFQKLLTKQERQILWKISPRDFLLPCLEKIFQDSYICNKLQQYEICPTQMKRDILSQTIQIFPKTQFNRTTSPKIQCLSLILTISWNYLDNLQKPRSIIPQSQIASLFNLTQTTLRLNREQLEFKEENHIQNRANVDKTKPRKEVH